MSEFLGKLHESAVKFPMTDIWMDSCGEEELNYGLERGCVGAPFLKASYEQAEELNETVRGAGGFGSTGTK